MPFIISEDKVFSTFRFDKLNTINILSLSLSLINENTEVSLGEDIAIKLPPSFPFQRALLFDL